MIYHQHQVVVWSSQVVWSRFTRPAIRPEDGRITSMVAIGNDLIFSATYTKAGGFLMFGDQAKVGAKTSQLEGFCWPSCFKYVGI